MTLGGPLLLSGVFAGAVHVVSGPDHLAAVLPLTARARRPALEAGAAWGLGHGLGVLALIAAGQLLRDAIDVGAVAGMAEFAVGLLLVFMGARTLRLARHASLDAARDRGHGHLARNALGFGLLHGVAGTTHLLAALPGAVADPAVSAWYGATYLVGAVLMMALAAGVVGRILVRTGHYAAVLRGTGIVAILVGVVWIAVSAA